MFSISKSVLGRSISRRLFHSSLLLNGKIIPFILADIGEGIAQVEVIQWFVKEGDKISQFDKIAEVQSDKAAVEITSRYDGIVKKLHYKVSDTAKVGSALVDIETDADVEETAPQPAPTPKEEKVAVADKSEKLTHILATPAVRYIHLAIDLSGRRMAREKNINLAKIKGTGREGRIMKEDLLAGPKEESKETVIEAVKQPVETRTEEGIAANKVPLNGMQRAMIKSMNAAMKVPHFGYNDEINMTNLTILRNELKPLALSKGVKLSFMPFFIKAASIALEKYPILNSSLDADEQNIIYHSSHNIGVAVDSPGGLIVPNIKNVQELSIVEIALELNRLRELAMKKQLTRNDLTGGTFTLSNIGSIGGTYASPILVVPEVLIGALGKIQKVPRFDKDDNVIATSILYVSWSADHRIIDGATVANFSNLWKEYLENPKRLYLDS